MDREPIDPECPLLTYAIRNGLDKTRNKDKILIEYEYQGKGVLLQLTSKLREILYYKEERNYLHDLILRGFRVTEENGLSNEEEIPGIILFSDYDNQDIIADEVKKLIMITDGSDSFSQLYLGNELTITLPADLKPEKGENDIYSDSEFIAGLVVNGFRVSDI